ncbi:MAG: hypothetical protein WD733_13355, partial [Bryobacterales bacterium]
MQRTEPDAGPKLLLEDYGTASQRWLQSYDAAKDVYKRADRPGGPSNPAASDQEIRVLIEPQENRTQRWLERFARDQADFGPSGRPVPNLAPRESPDLHLLIEDYDPGSRFVRQLAALASSNGTTVPATTNGSRKPGAKTISATVTSPGSLHVKDDLDLNLTIDCGDELSRARRRQAGVSSLVIHAALVAILVLQPHVAPLPAVEEPFSGMQPVTLVAPPASVLA